MISLFIDTSASDVSIAVIKDDVVLSLITENIPNKHSVYTTSFIDKSLREANLKSDDIDKIMVVNGPGSFTGVRIGVTIAKTYAYLLKKDIICISSLKMMAISNNHEYCLSLIDAHHDNYYLGLYDKNNNEVIEEQFNNKDKVMEIIDNYNPTIVSDNDIKIDNIEVKKVQLDVVKIVNYYKDYEALNCHLVVPNYLKLPQAMEVNK